MSAGVALGAGSRCRVSGGAPGWRGAARLRTLVLVSQPPNPYSAPRAEGALVPLVSLANIPFYRRNSIASALVLLALFLAFIAGPIVLRLVVQTEGSLVARAVSIAFGAPLMTVCVVVLTGDVYYESHDAQGQLKKWGVGNKVVAALIVLGWGYSIVSSFVG